jgi:hypothetical protein
MERMKKFDYSKFKSQKSQSAMEYLMTYGWAILIIAIVLVALFSLGIFNSANFAPRAQPGSCQVIKTSAQTSLAGQCNGMLPEYVGVMNNGYITLYTNPGDFLPSYTFNFWVYPKAYPAQIISEYAGISQQAPGCSFYYVTLNTVTYMGTWNRGNWIFSSFPNSVAPLNSWSMVTVTLTGGGNGVGTLSVYIDGGSPDTVASQEIYSQSLSTYNDPGSVIGISGSGCPGAYTGGGINGSLANLQFYNTTLSQSEITALYQEGIGGAPININNLVGWWPLNGNANDYSGNGNSGTATNVIYTSAWTSGYSTP